jgi:hypothetical protein
MSKQVTFFTYDGQVHNDRVASLKLYKDSIDADELRQSSIQTTLREFAVGQEPVIIDQNDIDKGIERLDMVSLVPSNITCSSGFYDSSGWVSTLGQFWEQQWMDITFPVEMIVYKIVISTMGTTPEDELTGYALYTEETNLRKKVTFPGYINAGVMDLAMYLESGIKARKFRITPMQKASYVGYTGSFQVKIRNVTMFGNAVSETNVIQNSEYRSFQNIRCLDFGTNNSTKYATLQFLGSVDPSGSWNDGSPVSCFLWLKLRPSTLSTLILVSMGSGSVQFQVNSNKLRIRYGTSGVTGSVTLVNDSWNHVGVVLSNSNPYFRLYVNGVLDILSISKITSDIPGNFVNTPSTIFEVAKYASCCIDEMIVFDGIVQPSDIQNIYNNGIVTNLLTLGVTNTCLAYWRFEDTLLYSAKDESGNRNHLQLVGLPERSLNVPYSLYENVPVIDRWENKTCIYFNGTSDEAYAVSGIVGPYSVSGWFKFTAFPATVYGFDNIHRFSVDSSGHIMFEAYQQSITSTGMITADKWTHLCFVRDTSNISVYANGNVFHTFTITSFVLPRGEIRFGKYGETAFTEYFVDEVSVFRQALDASDVDGLYHSGEPFDLRNFPKFSFLNAYWSFEEDFETFVVDRSGNSRHLFLGPSVSNSADTVYYNQETVGSLSGNVSFTSNVDVSNSNISVSTWVNLEYDSNVSSYIILRIGTEKSVLYDSSAQTLIVTNGASPIQYSIPSESFFGSWYHIGVVWGTNGVSLYINGLLVASETTSLSWSSASSFFIGS